MRRRLFLSFAVLLSGCSYGPQTVDEAAPLSEVDAPAHVNDEPSEMPDGDRSGDFLGAKTGPVDTDAPTEFTTTDSGLKYRILRKSDKAAPPDAAARVTVNYHGWLPDPADPSTGEVFDSSYERGEPSSFGLNQVIPGWTEGLQLVGEGGMIELEIPPQLGYGASGGGPIPGNATLRFVVELVEVQLPPTPGPVDADAPSELTTTASGLRYRILREGNGPAPTEDSQVLVHYRGWLPDADDPSQGREFDSSYQRGEPLAIPVRGVIDGWIEGIQLSKAGGMIELEVPPNLAYGGQEVGDIPANSTLRFIIELLEVR